jgi:hypothetical protein
MISVREGNSTMPRWEVEITDCDDVEVVQEQG